MLCLKKLCIKYKDLQLANLVDISPSKINWMQTRQVVLKYDTILSADLQNLLCKLDANSSHHLTGGFASKVALMVEWILP